MTPADVTARARNCRHRWPRGYQPGAWCHHCGQPITTAEALCRIQETPRTLIRRDGTLHRFTSYTIHPYCPNCEHHA